LEKKILDGTITIIDDITDIDKAATFKESILTLSEYREGENSDEGASFRGQCLMKKIVAKICLMIKFLSLIEVRQGELCFTMKTQGLKYLNSFLILAHLTILGVRNLTIRTLGHTGKILILGNKRDTKPNLGSFGIEIELASINIVSVCIFRSVIENHITDVKGNGNDLFRMIAGCYTHRNKTDGLGHNGNMGSIVDRLAYI
jgi:hypothetical protein